jgi:hypothetical protein
MMDGIEYQPLAKTGVGGNTRTFNARDAPFISQHRRPQYLQSIPHFLQPSVDCGATLVAGLINKPLIFNIL